MNAKDAIEHLQHYPDDTPVCFILWLPQDVIDRAKEQNITLDADQAGEVLESLHDNHDCNYGITWETIDVQLDGLVKDQQELVDEPNDLESILKCSIEELTIVKDHKTDLFTDGENHFTIADGAGTNYRLWSVTLPSD